MTDFHKVVLCVCAALYAVIILIAIVEYCSNNRNNLAYWEPFLKLFDKLNNSGKDVYFMLYLPLLPIDLLIHFIVFLVKTLIKPFYDVLSGSAFKDKESE